MYTRLNTRPDGVDLASRSAHSTQCIAVPRLALTDAHFDAFNLDLADAVRATNAALLAAAPASVAPRRGGHHRRVGRIAAASLFYGRGDAHTDDTGLPQHNSSFVDGRHSWKGFTGARDCLHFCHSPGVLDALALATLAELRGPIRDGVVRRYDVRR